MTNMTHPLLVELFVEELPPKALKKLGEAFSQTLLAQLQNIGLASSTSHVTAYATPRRLGARITDVATKAADKAIWQKLMPVAVGLDASGNATPALAKKLQSLGIAAGAVAGAVATLKRMSDGKVDNLIYEATASGATLVVGLQQALAETIAKLPIPKVMTYQLADGWTDVKFVRPVHSFIALHGTTALPVTALGLTASNTTQGHRFEAKVPLITIQNADSYEAQMQDEGAVIASYAARRQMIADQLAAAASQAGQDLRAIEDEALLDEVTSLVERPNVLTCEFEREFLDVPQECLILTMKANQKYFPLLDAKGKLSNKFLVVSNISPSDPSAVIEGNERVVRPRLADAKFFFDQDRKRTLESRVESLTKVVYHNKLGTQGERTERVAAIAASIVKQLSNATLPFTVQAKDEFDVLASKVAQAARLAKTDLLTDMVGEFPELQGIMGGYYARHDGLRDGVAIAIEDHYKPRFAGDALPRNHTGTVVALADKLETLVGMFGIGNLPTGDKDPFALRRHALGVIRMLVEKNLPLALPELLAHCFPCFTDKLEGNPDDACEALTSFIYDRFAGSLREQGYTAQEVDAVLSMRPTRLGDVPKRLDAVRAFAALPESTALAAANKRVGNILKKVAGTVTPSVNLSLLKEQAEIDLNAALALVQPLSDVAYEQGDYTAALTALAKLKAPVDAFFEHVMVNADDAALKANRLGLLATLHAAMNRVADLSKLAS
ncbi:MAG: glycine--tRNA ligase subunit beta [Cytophagales bacterium]|nr:glycine--tRNA ligase subunit beta [Cytophagales bacterium]